MIADQNSKIDDIIDDLSQLYSYKLSPEDAKTLTFLLYPFITKCKKLVDPIERCVNWEIKHFVFLMLHNEIDENSALNYLIEALYYIPRLDILYECSIGYEEYEREKLGKLLDPKRILIYKLYDNTEPKDFTFVIEHCFSESGLETSSIIKNDFLCLDRLYLDKNIFEIFLNKIKEVDKDHYQLIECYEEFVRKNDTLSPRNEQVSNLFRSISNSDQLPIAIEKGTTDNYPYFGSVVGDTIKFKDFDYNSETYPEQNIEKSICLIINIWDYKENKRTNTNIDVDNLTKTFENIHFSVFLVENVSSDELFEILPTYTKAENNVNPGAMIVCAVMAHGYNDGIFDINMTKIPYNKLYKEFNGTHCTAYRGKPKIFIFQACRGEKDHIDVQNYPYKKIKNRVKNNRIPEEADFITLYATTKECKAIRSLTDGSPLIESFKNAIENIGCESNLIEIMRYVVSNVSNKEFHKREFCQMPEVSFTTRCNVYIKKPEIKSSKEENQK